MGTLLDKPVTEKDTGTEKGPDGVEFGFSAMQGWRVDMEDAHTIVAKVDGLEGHSFVAVYDGHGGDLCAMYAGENMLRHITETPQFNEYVESTTKDTKLLEDALHKAFLDADRGVKDAQDANRDGDRSGCTAVVAFVTPTHLVLAHAGDSRAVLASGDEVAASTRDHKPYNNEERERIEKAGGVVSMKRVDGDLAVSRALGDFQYKNEELPPERCKVTVVPETRSIPRSHSADEFLIVACDGIWDVMSDECLNQGSRDNMSVVLVTFPGLKKGTSGYGVKGRRSQRAMEGSESFAEDLAQEEKTEASSKLVVAETTST